MKSYYWWVVGLLAIIILACRIEGVSAAPLQYYGTPIFYSKAMADEYPCVYNNNNRYGFCGEATLPEEGEIGLTDPNDPNHGMSATIRLYTELTCSQGVCQSNYTEKLGTITDLKTGYWYIPTGYYLSNVDGKYVAYRHGTGPLAKEFPMGKVLTLGYNPNAVNGYSRQYKDNLDRYDVHCNSIGECSYMGRVMMLSQLADLVPKILTFNCDENFCYNQDLTVAGINPKVVITPNWMIHPMVGLTQQELNAKQP